jgi:3-phenylpropionate/trans-cinnamate dioxygenase ferredoxin reductase subunit
MDVVIIGGGLAAGSAVDELRGNGHAGEITVLTAEPYPPYERPPLSKDLLLGKVAVDEVEGAVAVHDAGWYAEQQVDLRIGVPATAIDTTLRRVTAGGRPLGYDTLLFATGAEARRLPQLDEPAADSGLPLTYLRTLDDAVALRRTLVGQPDGRLLIVGAGWIGLEVAAAARLAGWSVTVVDPAPTPLHAVLGPRLGSVFADLHRGHGVDLRLDSGVAGIDGRSVTLKDGHHVTPDLVVVGVGASPADGLARDAGLTADNGVWVDARLRSSDPAVYAVGDVAAQDHPVLGHRLRVEHWDTAAEQGRAAARLMLGGDEAYTRLPYFFTDQYDSGMEYLGHVPPGQQTELVVRAGTDFPALTAFWLSGRRVLAGMHIDDWDAMDPIRGLVGHDVDVARLRDPGVSLSDLSGAVAG